MRQALEDAILQLASGYSHYVTATPGKWLETVNGTLVRQVETPPPSLLFPCHTYGPLLKLHHRLPCEDAASYLAPFRPGCQCRSCPLQMTNRMFLTGVTLLSAFWKAGRGAGESSAEGAGEKTGQGPEGALLSAWILAQLARLQFCRTRLPAYSELLKGVLPAVACSKQVPSA